MPKSKKLSKNALVKIGVAVAKGEPRRTILAQHKDAPERLVRELQRVRLGQDEYREMMQGDLRDAASKSVKSYLQDLADGKVPPSTKPIAAGIFVDKANALEGRAQIQNVSVNVLVNRFGDGVGPTKAEILASLGAALLPVSGDGGNQFPLLAPGKERH